MLGMVLAAFVIGIVVAMPPGPVIISGSQRAIVSGFWRACTFYMGSGLTDTFYALLVYFGLSALLSGSEVFKLALWILGGAWLCKMGYDAVRSPIDLSAMQTVEHADTLQTRWKDFRSGVFVTLFNPLTIVAWTAIAGNFFAQWSADWPARESAGLIAILAMMTGIMGWALGLALALSIVRRMISPRLLRRISVISGWLLVLYGLSAWWSAADLLI